LVIGASDGFRLPFSVSGIFSSPWKQQAFPLFSAFFLPVDFLNR